MLVVLPFCNKDKPIAVHLAEWINDLGGVKAHECMLIHPPSTEPGGVLEPLREAFKKLFILRTPDDLDGWPQGPNLMFRRAARQIEAASPQPWLWLEPDAIPLSQTWLDEIEGEYKAVDKRRPFLGVRVKVQNVREHMSGIGVYPGNAPTLAPLLVRCNKVAFDVNAQSEVLPRMTETRLIQHDWQPPTFTTADDLNRLRAGAVIYHQCKDGSLIARLREQRGTTPGLLETDLAALADLPSLPAAVALAASPEGEEPAPGATVALAFTDAEDAIQQLCSRLKQVYDLGKNEARMVGQYLAAAGLIPSSPLAPPKKKPVAKKPARKEKAPPSLPPAETQTQQPEQ